ncbi:hypothetical protein [Leptothoe spongobia]|uniref:Uncharacterized protein n=1 Tax=Leptothoe spongobia TAU-MAC 1115 TaxID=1967444 RepID=A0A947GGC8_9CYAN|nr:hypothetical protein [Leptothoe spongobia]MBT9314860.1 hypothetical protein [Leptothoe spongobia TAU-MAC 1115]
MGGWVDGWMGDGLLGGVLPLVQGDELSDELGHAVVKVLVFGGDDEKMCGTLEEIV